MGKISIKSILKVESRLTKIPAILTFAAVSAGAGYLLTTGDRDLARAAQDQGIYIFTDSRPVGEYQHLTTLKPKTVQIGTNIQGQDGLSTCSLTYDQLKADFLKQIKKKHSDANGLIIHPETETGEAIIIK